MARRNIEKIPFFASVAISDSTAEQLRSPIAIRNTILQSSQANISGWNKHNFLNSIENGSSEKISILFVKLINGTHGDLVVWISSDEHLTLEELVETLEDRYPASLVFLDVTECEDIDVRSLTDKSSRDDMFFIVFRNDASMFYFSLACELNNFWGLVSYNNTDVNFDDFLKVVKAIIDNYRSHFEEAVSISKGYTINYSVSNPLLWSHDSTNKYNVDIEKFSQNARKEQIDDVIKRVFDVSAHSRLQHDSTHERLASSQGLFWLAQSEGVNDVANWISYTRFFYELHPEYNVQIKPTGRYPKSKTPFLSFLIIHHHDIFAQTPQVVASTQSVFSVDYSTQ